MIEVDIEQGATTETRGGIRHFLRETVTEQDPIGQRRKGIKVGLAVEALVSGALRQGDCEALCELPSVSCEVQIAGRRLTVTHCQNRFDPIANEDGPHPEEVGAYFFERLEKTVARLFATRDGEPATLGCQGRDHVIVELDAADREIGQISGRQVNAGAARSV